MFLVIRKYLHVRWDVREVLITSDQTWGQGGGVCASLYFSLHLSVCVPYTKTNKYIFIKKNVYVGSA